MAGWIANFGRLKAVPAFARAGFSLFDKTKPTKNSNQATLDFGVVAALAGIEILECDQLSTILAVHNSKLRPEAKFIDRVHIVDRPALLLALSYAASAPQKLVVKVESEPAQNYVEQEVSIQSVGGKLFVAFQLIDKTAAAKHAKDTSRELAHELRTPIAAMVGLADAISSNQICTAEMRETYPALIAKTGRDLIELTSSILDQNDAASAQSPMKFGALVQDCVALLLPSAKTQSIALYNRVPTKIAERLVDGTAMRQILINLISNAIKHSPAGTSVEISASTSANGWTLSIADNGHGIAPEDVARLGQKNFRGENSAGISGHGLGLSIVFRHVEALSARISFESRPGKGTKVSIAFPASKLVELADYQSRINDVPVSTPFFNNAAGAKHAAA